MSELEQDLRRMLARVDPPAGFAERVLSRLPQAPAPQGRAWRLPVAAGVLLALAGSGVYQYQQLRGRENAAKLVKALDVTSRVLLHTKSKLHKTRRDI